MANVIEYVISLKDLLTSKLKEAEAEADKLNDKMSGLEGMAKKIGAAVVAGFAIDKLSEFGSHIVSTLGEFERYDAVLTNTLGSSSESKKILADITDFASKTPFAVNELTDSYVKLANQGFKPTMNEMTKLGDLASSTGKGFGQLGEAILDAQSGEFERLKEFGIKSSKSGDQVSFTFKGIKTTVDNTSASIQQYLLGLGEAQGVTGAMAAISQTTEGQISNLDDNVNSLYLTLGTELKPVIAAVISGLNGFVDAIKSSIHWLKDNMDLVKAIGIGLGVAAAIWGVYTIAVNISTIATAAWTAAQWLLNIALTANPLGIIVVAIGAFVAAIVYAWEKVVGFRAVITGIWGVIREFGSIITDVFGGVWKTIHGVFTFNKDEVAQGFAQTTDAMKNAGVRMATAYKEGYDGVMADDAKKKAAEKEKPAMAPTKPATKAAAATAAKKDTSPKGATGTKSVTINISIGKLIETFKVQTTNMGEGAGKIKEKVAETLLGAINDSQIVAGI